MFDSITPWVAHELPLLLHSGFLKAAPLLWAALGGAFSERSGIINIGLEGMMLTGAFVGVAISFVTGNPWLGLALGALCGGVMGLIHAVVCLYFRADQIVSGMGINLFALGLTGFLLQRVFNTIGNSPDVNKLPTLQGEWLSNTFLSELLFPLSPLHIALILVACWTIYLFYSTRFGLRMRGCGEAPNVVKSAGVNVAFYRYTAVCLSGVLAGLGGVQLSLSDINQFSTGMTNGRGFIALAALICSGWNPKRIIWICLFFGCMDAFGERMQSSFPSLPSRASQALPFMLVLIVLAFRRQANQPPAALGKA